jgi:hypothetical protein
MLGKLTSGSKSTGSRVSEMRPSSTTVALSMNIVIGR